MPEIAYWKRKYRRSQKSQIYKTWKVPEKKTPQSNSYLREISTDGSNHINPRQIKPDTCRCRGVNVVTRYPLSLSLLLIQISNGDWHVAGLNNKPDRISTTWTASRLGYKWSPCRNQAQPVVIQGRKSRTILEYLKATTNLVEKLLLSSWK